MKTPDPPIRTKRYHVVSDEKASGSTYTPKILADFVAQKMVEAAGPVSTDRTLRILDPAIGHGELLISLLEKLEANKTISVEVYGFETDPSAIAIATSRIQQQFPDISIYFEPDSFLEYVREHVGPGSYDLIIANPPYVRTQIMGASQSQLLTEQFGLAGRVDLYHAFILGISQLLKPQGIAGIIVSNRFMSTKSGASVREAICRGFNLRHTWDLGDTKLFDAAVLPAVLLAEGKSGHRGVDTPAFTSIYQTTAQAKETSTNVITALDHEGMIKVADGRCFHVQHGTLNTSGTPDGVWRMGTDAVDSWLANVESRSWGVFRDIGKIRVGVKTCADKVFIRNDWQTISDRPELLKPLTTHHVARRFKALVSDRPSHILYPHEVVQGRRRAVDLSSYPRTQTYLEENRPILESRRYLIEAGREWYEIWVPQDPDIWDHPKLVFRDIAEEPTFWIDLDGSVVNGDCYWLTSQNPTQTDLLWLAAAIGNSTFIERFYDLRFNNKLYAGRRRFITQYVEKFPLPDPHSPLAKAIITQAKQIYECASTPEAGELQAELDCMVWEALTGDKPN